ncbi:2Fe-2S iron-sulfur cluster-binding protein [Mangrovicoccus algicola]|uniref:2Fe-2S iron-sulfur cluster binding domain-containing protein n=1 Tax=Mangrovicoccus algicola TaxID=2771008 RepID=A0A8J6YX62_9RHOB|nr:2Fe-2S iron-sulfur cluster-binding protein [Mangrovicoccus algicola]MBE3639262.1 2Fe-2S iron-sulfur cluster binding domain-containing protein [Mangrovicoccus algicola]
MVQVHFVAHDGTRTSVEAEAGTSIMAAAVANGIDGIVGECGGAAMCATCHVYLDPADAARVPDRAEIEEEMLDSAAAEVTGFSRLSCQITLEPGLDGLVVHLPQSQH